MEQRKIEYTIVDINSIKSHPKNVRQGDIGAISESLKAHGQYRPIVVDKRTNCILAGNHTWKAAKSLGWTQISAGFVETKDDDEALRILLADNRTTDLATYDDTGLADLLKNLSTSDVGLVGTLFDGDDLDDLLFKLEGSVGFVADRPSAPELIAEFELTDSRNLVLPFSKKEIEKIKEKLQTLMTELNKESYSEVLIFLLDYYDQSN
jgi:hypothetical protein